MIPERIKQAIDNHVFVGRPCGSFITAVLENDLRGAMGHADPESLAALPSIVSYCYNNIPGHCWGSKEVVKAWRDKGGDPRAYIEPYIDAELE